MSVAEAAISQKIIAGCMKENGKVVGIDPDRRLIQQAEKSCKRKLISNIHFKIGHIWKNPLERLNGLYGKFHIAFGTAIDKGWRQKLDMSSYIEDFYFRIPQLFLKAGLTDIAMNGYLSTFLLCDHGRSAKKIRTYLQAKLNLWKKLKKRNEKCALMGGMNEQEFHELPQKYTDY